ncbi:MAG: phosphoribosylglycinamide formyltransferase [Promethearchaeota archaeon]
MKFGVLISGGGTNLQSIIDKVEAGYIPNSSIEVVISTKQEAYGLTRAKNHNIPAIFLDPKSFWKKPNKEELRVEYDKIIKRTLDEYNVEFIVLAGYMLLLSAHFVDQHPLKIVNIHPAILPAHRGTSGVKDAFEYGGTFTGVTVHFVDTKLDHGSVILQAYTPMLPGETVESLKERNLNREWYVYPEVLRLLALGKVEVQGRTVKITEPNFYKNHFNLLNKMALEDIEKYTLNK